MLFRKEQVIGQQTCPAEQRALCRDPGKFRKIIIFR